MNRLWALLAAAGCLYVAVHSVTAGIQRPDYLSLLFGLVFAVLAMGFVHFGIKREAA